VDFTDAVPLTAYTTPPYQLLPGWRFADYDEDGIPNAQDPDFMTPEQFYAQGEDIIESAYKRLTTKKVTIYSFLKPSLVESITKTEADGEQNISVFRYPFQQSYSLITGLASNEISAYAKLEEENRISEPIQISAFTENILIATSRRRFRIEAFTPGSSSLTSRLDAILLSKGPHPFEVRTRYPRYDTWGNPSEIVLGNGNVTSYKWALDRKLLLKAENVLLSALESAAGQAVVEYDPNNPPPPFAPNPYAHLLPEGMVTLYNYTDFTRQLKTIVEPSGKRTTYEYDVFNRLKYLKDRYGNIVHEYDYHYQTQN